MTSDFDACNFQDNILVPSELLEEHLKAFADAECVFNPEVLELQDGLDYFTLKEERCIYDLTLNNYFNISNKESVLYIDDFKHLRGNIKLQYFGKLKIVAKGDLYLDEVTFLNTSEVEITAGYEKNNRILPLITCSHIWLSSTVTPEFRIHDISSLSLIGDIVACNAFKLHNIASINSTKLRQLLSDDIAMNLASFIDWNGAVSSCQKSESKKINIFASNKINLLSDSKLVSSDLSITGSDKADIYIAGLVASTSLLSIDSGSLNVLDDAKIKFSGSLATFKSKNFVAGSGAFFDFHNAEIESSNFVINSKISWDGSLKLKWYSAAETEANTVDMREAKLYGSRLVFDNISNVKATKESIAGISECIWKSEILHLHDDLEWLASCQLSSDIIQVKSCNFAREKGSVIKAQSFELVIDGDDCLGLSFLLHGIIDISGDTVIRSSKLSEIQLNGGSILKTGSLTIDVESGELKCDGCRITVNGEVINSIKLNKLVVTSEIGLNIETKTLSALSDRDKFDCYEPVFVSERCTVKIIQSNGENLFITQTPYYIKIGSVLIEGALNLEIKEIIIENSAFIIDGKLAFQAQVDKLTLEATKGFRKVTLAPVSVDIAIRSDSGRGYIIERVYSSHEYALNHFNKYNVAHDFGLISRDERDECIRAQSAKDVYCPIYVEGREVIRNTDGLQSIFHAKSYDGASISGLSVGLDVPDKSVALISDNMPDVRKVDINNQWSNEVARHKTLLKDTVAVTSLENIKHAAHSEVQVAISGDSKVAVLKRHRLSGEIALNLDNLGAYEVYSSAKMQEHSLNALPGSSSIELIWNILDYPKSSREFMQDDELILKLFKCVRLEFTIVSLANQDLMQDLLSDLIFATVGKLNGISSARLLEHLVDNTCAIYEKLEALGAKPGIPLTHKQKQLFATPGVWPFWLTDCPGGHSRCISLELALNEQSIDKMLPSGAKLSADEHIILDGTQLKLGMSGNIVAGESIKAKLVGDTRLDGRVLASEIEGHVDGNLKNVGIISGGKVLMFANNIINLGLIEATKSLAFQALGDFIAAGFLGSEGSLSLDVAHKLTLLSLKEIALLEMAGIIKEVSQNVAHITSVIAGGALEISAGGDILNIGAEVVGASVFISTSDKIVTVPLELYNEVVKAGKYCYESYKGSKFIKPIIKASGNKAEDGSASSKLPKEVLGENAPALIEKEIARIKNKSGTVVIIGKKEVQIIGSDISGTGDVALASEEGGISVKSIKPWKETIITTRGSDLVSRWGQRDYLYDEEVSESSIKSGGTLHSYSLKDQEWVGASIKVVSIRLAAGSPEHKASIAILPIQKTKVIEVETKSSNFSIKLQEGGVSFIDKTHKKKYTASIKQVATIIEMEEEFLGYSSGQFTIIDPGLIDRSEDEHGNIHVKIKADEINLEAAPEVEASYSYIDQHGVGVGFSAKGGEFAVKGCVFGKSSEKNLNKVTYKTPKPFRGWIELDAKTVKDAGVLYHAQSLHINAEIEIHGIVMNEENEGDIRSLFEAGVKFGIKSNLGSIEDSTASIAKGDINRPEGLINTAFQSYKLYVEALKLLSPGHGLSGGSWFYMHADETTKDKKAAHPVPTIIDVLDLKSKSSELQLLGTQVLAYRGYIEAKYMKGDAAKNGASSNMSSSSLDIEIPIAATVPPNIQVAIQKATEKSELYLNTNIYVSDRLTIKIAGRADLKGVSISAGKLEASFNELVLESLQNVIESGGFGSSLGGGIGKEGGLDSLNIGNQIQDRSRHVVESLTMLLGRESVHIVIAEALRMNGALIANADRDSDGKFTDHGNLTLKVGELFVQHIYDYDKGLTLGAALSYTGSTKYGQPYIDAMPTFGRFNKDGITRSTIGKGSLGEGASGSECADLSKVDAAGEGLNRDLRNVQEFGTKHNIEPITAYFTTIDTEKLRERIPKNFDEFAKSYFDTVKALLLIKPEPKTIEQEKEPEEDEHNNKKHEVKEDSAGGRAPDDEEELSARGQAILDEELQTREGQILFRKMADDLEVKYGAERAALLLEVGRERLVARLKGLENIKESQYAVDGDKLIIRLPNAGIVPAGVMDRGLDIVFEIVDSPGFQQGLDTSAKFGSNILRIGKYTVRINPYVAATMTAYDIGNYLVESGDAKNVVEFAKETASTAADYAQREFAKIKDKVSEGIKSKLKSEARSKVAEKGAANPDPDDFEPWDKKGKSRVDDSEFQGAKSEGKIEYKDADYHHQQSQGTKSPSPKSEKDAIEALKNSVKVSENSDRRIGVDVKNEEFIVFDKTRSKSDGGIEYHGHVRNWNDLHPDQQRALHRAGIIRNIKTGK